MIRIFGKNYYLDLDKLVEMCEMDDNDDTEEPQEARLNVFKFELYKMLVESILNEGADTDSDTMGIGMDDERKTTLSFKFTFNTLLANGIIIEEEN